ncbi:DUF6482 family protein [Aliiglaciecola sp. LCG003]|uniref:DUF6482 family protein n=1 Tax=Aliiglaciecola sp. LCG003 TaxID=3053655 RepID=UPI0025728142|nr:DUF6482 family protein [Aliiglaciecola sp. LCG003]WJG09377.1 DUF6482 family protein [Aliiglaciecola sp. LCG003]
MKFDYERVIRDKITIDLLEVQSFEMSLYLVKLHVGNNQGMLYQGPSLKRFHSAQQIRDAFEVINVSKAIMVHESPYDEMIGNPPKAKGATILPFSMSQPY